MTRLIAHNLMTAAIIAAALFFSPASHAESERIPNAVESAVDRGIEWLARNQERDGSWSAGGTRGSRAAAVTGLAAMALMARGHVPGQGPYGENLNRAIDYLLSLQQGDGALASDGLNQVMYDHGICTVALCEAFGMLDDRRQELARIAISRAVRLILTAQKIPKNNDDQGGWRYTTNTDQSDTSVTGWQLMALRGAANVGASVPKEAIDAGIAYIKRRAVLGGGFNYQGNNNPNAALTGTGVLALILLGQPNAPEVKAGGDYLLRTPASSSSHYFYSVYYCAQAAWQLGGLPGGEKYWNNINREISSDLLKRQAGNGSWAADVGSDAQGGESYSTSMAILALTVPYRYLPIYQR